MRRIMLRIAYDGTDYVGWQKQPNGLAVEEAVNKALLALTGENIEVIGASRTDSGVHALGNVAVFDTESRIPGEKFCYALNKYLPEDIRVQESIEVSKDFHPRHTDCTKTYEYRIYNAAQENPLVGRYSHFYHGALDTEAMQRAGQLLIGEHDFASFCSAGAQVKTTVRTVYSLEVETEPMGTAKDVKRSTEETSAGQSEVRDADNAQAPQMIVIRIRGNGFLYNMVRIIAGTLIEVGRHAILPEAMAEIVSACDRSAAGPTAPARGLRLVHIEYEEDDLTGQRNI